ncbi:MAG TPA: ATP-binding protein [Candidatus Magasanikbacteria bacterium]|nr:ATP-binding protein [Candidatus Magasanikbacteria bacterium]
MMTRNNGIDGIPSEVRDYKNFDSAWELWNRSRESYAEAVRVFGLLAKDVEDYKNNLTAKKELKQTIIDHRSEMVVAIAKVCMAGEIMKSLPAHMQKYHDHDASGFARLSDSLGGLLAMEFVREEFTNADMEKWPEVENVFLVWGKQVMQFIMVAEDLLLRSAESGYDLSRRDIDADRPALELVNTLDAMLTAKKYLGAKISYFPSREVVAALYLSVPHGTIFNFIQNCASNAAFYEFMAKNISLSVEIEGADLVFKVKDDGVGLKREKADGDFDDYYTGEMIKLFGEGTTGKKQSGRGLGIAHADQRFASLGASVSVESAYYRPNRNADDEPAEGDGTTFSLRVPIIEKTNTQQ